MDSRSSIEVPFIRSVDQHSSIDSISLSLDRLEKNTIGYAPWPEFQYRPACEFAMAYGNDCILLKFFVIEDDILARFTQPNDMVYKDSCVEFFIAFNGEAEYYNLEFNCIGTCYLGYGSTTDREVANVEIVKKIKTSFLLYSDKDKIKWELTLLIPNSVFYRHNNPPLSLSTARANFFKCGDDLPVPHYLTWNNIEAAEPNFHLPEFFGDLTFHKPTED